MSGYVYILKSDIGKYYIGSTKNPAVRFYQYRNGHTQTTRNMKAFKGVLLQEYENIKKAQKIENRIKKLKRRDYIDRMVKDGFIKIE